MVNESHTRCFWYVPDHHPLMDSVHAEPAIDRLALLLLRHLELIADFSTLILQDTGIIPPGAPSITEIYQNLNGGSLDDTQAELANLLEQVYQTEDQQRLNARRGAILERIVFNAVKMRQEWVGDEIRLNAHSLKRPAAHEKAPNGYSVDVAACFSRKRTIELYACKLQVGWMPDKELKWLDDLGEYFAASASEAHTAVCCIQSWEDLAMEEDYWARLELFQYIHTYSIDDIDRLVASE